MRYLAAWLVVALVGASGAAAQTVPHQRTLTMALTATSAKLTFAGAVTDATTPGTGTCASRARVLIEREINGTWGAVKTATAGTADANGTAAYRTSIRRVAGTYRARVPAIPACVEAISPTVTAKKLPASCSVTARDGAGGLAEFTISCARDIVNGEIDLDINRSGCERGCEPKVKRPPGSDMFCGAAHRGSAGTAERIACEGSLPAGQRLIVRQSFGDQSPCDRPTFKGTYRVRFGGGVKLGPRKLPAYRCRARIRGRRFTDFFIGSEPGGGFGWVANLQPVGSFEGCVLRVPILIQKRSGGGWRTVLRLRSPSHGSNTGAAQMHGQMPAGTSGPAGYRIVAPRVRIGNQTCARATRAAR